jgi:signal transduction histidine kinase
MAGVGRVAPWGDIVRRADKTRRAATARRAAAGRRAGMARRADKVRRAAADPRAPMAIAVLLAVAAAGQAIAVAVDQSRGVSHGPLAALASSGWLLASFVVLLPSLAATLPLGLFCERLEIAAATICAANLVSLGVFRLLTVGGLVAQVIVLYRLGRRGPQWLAAGLTVPFLVFALFTPAGHITGLGAWQTAMAIAAAAVGPLVAYAGAARQTRSLAAAQTTTSEAFAGTLLENAARGERARISRELHDVVAHHVSMIAVQAETARLATPGMPAAGAQQLSAIGDTARAALTEMRRLLGVLREDSGTETADRQPQPGLAQLNELLDEAREVSGIGARLIVSGWLTALDPGVELAAYRIVQEALTNSRRHAPGAAVDVELHFTNDALHVRIRDNGPGPAAEPSQPRAGHGHGLLGMRERAAAVGGEFRAGSAPGGGFVVQAKLPAKAEAAR